jgi:hypothetical protein
VHDNPPIENVNHFNFLAHNISLPENKDLEVKLSKFNHIRKVKEKNVLSETSSSHGGEYDVQNCLLGCTAV